MRLSPVYGTLSAALLLTVTGCSCCGSKESPSTVTETQAWVSVTVEGDSLEPQQLQPVTVNKRAAERVP